MIKDFVTCRFKSSILPLSGYVGVVCGGPPCQGVSGFNRFGNYDNPLDDEKNKQLMVFMDIVQYIRPRFTLTIGNKSVLVDEKHFTFIINTTPSALEYKQKKMMILNIIKYQLLLSYLMLLFLKLEKRHTI